MRVVDQQCTSSASSQEKDLVPIVQGPRLVLGPVYEGCRKTSLGFEPCIIQHVASCCTRFAAPTTHHLYSHYFI